MKTWSEQESMKFKDYTANKGGAHCDIPSLWVPKSLFIGMTQDKFIGQFKIWGGKSSKSNAASLEKYAKTLPCTVLIHMAQTKKAEPVKCRVNLLDFGWCDKDHVGICIAGIKN